MAPKAHSDVPKPGPRPTKKRRVQKSDRACDYCRRKKIKCDGPMQLSGRCSKCKSRNAVCTYDEPFVRNDYPNSYVESLESRLGKLEKLFKQRCPDVDLARELEKELDGEPENSPIASSSASSSLRSTIAQASTMVTPASGSTSSTPLPQPPSGLGKPDHDHRNEEDSMRIQNEIVKGLSRLSIDPVARNYHGKSSGLVFIRTAKRLAQQPDDARKASPIVDTQPSPDSAKAEEEAWSEPEPEAEIAPFKDFPPPDLMDHLIALYFSNVNIYTPLLHAPTFLNSLRNGEHLRDGGFGATVLLVCANGARFSADPRVFAHGTRSPSSRGWKWFSQVECARKSYRAPSRLYDLQACALMTLFLHNSTRILQSWTVTGVGLRRALEVGAHRKHLGAASLTIENELWRRAFWVLVVMDWDISHAFGRPCMILEEDIDVPLLTECDDEHWTHGESGTAPRQPPGKPSKLSFYNSFIRLTRILAYATRTIYAIRKSHAPGDDGDQQQRVVAELDSSLNQWADSVPAHLKWDPHREDEVFLRQSANLHAYFYQVQVCVHRAFILPYHESPLSFPSLIICTNAARACIRLLDELCARIGTPVYRNLGILNLCGLVLFYKRWANRQAGNAPAVDQDLGYVRKCLGLIKAVQNETPGARGLWIMLSRLLEDESDPPPTGNTDLQAEHHASSSNTSPHVPRPASNPGVQQSFSPSVFTFGQHAHGVPGSSQLAQESGMNMDIVPPLPLRMEDLLQTPAGSFGTVPSSSLGWRDYGGSFPQQPSAGPAPNMPFIFQMLLQQEPNANAHGAASRSDGAAMHSSEFSADIPPSLGSTSGAFPPEPMAPTEGDSSFQDLLTSLGWSEYQETMPQ